MLQGHIDAADHRLVSGWAADDADADAVVAVVVYVNGKKEAFVKCSDLRPDLRHTGIFGTGAHGFRHHFEETLDETADNRVEVRFATTGKLLARGDILLRRDGTTFVREALRHGPPTEPELFPAPYDPRSMLECFVLYEQERGLLELLSKLNFRDERPRHLRFSALAVTGEAGRKAWASEPVDTCEYTPRDYLNHLLLSDEFQTNLIPIFLNAFQEKSRSIFIHIPKCAGTDLTYHLSSKLPSLHQTIMEPSWTTKRDLLQKLAKLMLEVRFFDSIFICGHCSLDYYSSRGLIRPRDSAFTVLRDPLEISLSHINYIMTRMSDDAAAGGVGTDTRQWMTILGLDALPTEMTPSVIQKLGSEILRTPRLLRPNSMCFWLGGTNALQAIDHLIANDVEITTTANYNAWLHSRWRIDADTRLNRSRVFMSLSEMPSQDLAYIHEINSEDVKLYSFIAEALERTATVAIAGGELS